MFLEREAQLCERNINKQGEELRKQIGASAYIECSSKTQQVDKTTQKDVLVFVEILYFASLLMDGLKMYDYSNEKEKCLTGACG